MNRDGEVGSRAGMDRASPTAKWTRCKARTRTAVFIIAVGVFVAAAFIGGYFVGRGALRSSRPLAVEEGVALPSPATWREAVCNISRGTCPPGFDSSPLILLSMDGFAAKYFRLHHTPSIEHLMQCAVHAPYMNPVYPTKTFPNHYSIVTGLYPASHGIVDNTMFDPDINRKFSISSNESSKKEWWLGEPIWRTAQRQGVKTATFFWPGSDVSGQKADYYIPYNRSVPFVERIRQVLAWLEMPAELRPQLITLYFEEPDASGHRYGPDSDEVKEALKKVDYFVSLLLEGLHARDLIGCVNLVIVSDHGMESINCNRVVSLFELSPTFNKENLFTRDGTVGRLRPLVNSSEMLLNDLQTEFQCKTPRAQVYRHQDFPFRWHYAHNKRIDPILFDLEPRWLLSDRNDSMPKRDCTGGDHGYDNLHPDMRSIFLATGPAFKQFTTSEPFMNIQLYNLFSLLLDVEPSPNNGTIGALFHLLADPPSFPPEVIRANPNACAVVGGAERYINSSGCDAESEKDVPLKYDNYSLLTPWGVPQVAQPNSQLCLLADDNLLIGYDADRRLTKWMTFNVDPRVKLRKFGADFGGSDSDASPDRDFVWANDPRLSPVMAPVCRSFVATDYLQRNVSLIPLSQLETSSKSFLISSAVPMYRGFYAKVYRALWSKIDSWRDKFPHMNIVLGPAWTQSDENRTVDAISESIPTHYYAVIIFCLKPEVHPLHKCPIEHLDTVAFILPHKEQIPSCWDAEKYLMKHQANINNIELLTGMTFFADIPKHVSVRLRLKLLQTSALSLTTN